MSRFKMKTALGILLLVACTSAFPLAFKERHRYTFQYQTEVVHSIPGSASKQIGLQLQCDCHVTIVRLANPAEAQIKLENVKINRLGQKKPTPIQADPEGIKALQDNPVELIFTATGRVKTIRVSAQDPEWSVNIKRGIANLLQVAPKQAGMDPKMILVSSFPVVISQKEETIVGRCPVTYTVEPWVNQHHENVHRVTKTIDYERCADRPFLRESINLGQLCPACQQTLGYVPYLRHAGHIEYILINRFLMQARAIETHIFRPYSEFAGQVEASATQKLQFVSERKSRFVHLLQKPRATTLKMKIVHPEQEIRQNPKLQAGIRAKVVKLQTQLAQEVQKDISSHLVPKIVTELVSHLRLCDVNMLEATLKEFLNQPNKKVRQLCFDAISLAATPEFAQLLNKLLKEKRTSEIPLPLFNRILVNIVFVPEVTPQHVDAVFNLCENAPEFQPKERLPIRRQCYMSYGILVNRLSQRGHAVLQRADVQTTITTAIKTLHKKLKQAQNVDDRLCFIKAIGNAGQPEHQEIILKRLKNSKEMIVRVECVWALRRMVSPKYRDNLCSQLFQIFQNRKENPELRMAIVELILDRQPSFLNMQLFLNSAIRETLSQGPRSKQVASWVISKLASMAYYNNAILKERASRARRALSSVRQYVSQINFGIEYSKAMRIAMYSERFLSGFELEMNKMNVPQSYLPRNMNARLLVYFMGQRMEVIQAGARIEGLQDTIQDLVSEIRSRHKRSIWSSIWEIFNDNPKPEPSSVLDDEVDESGDLSSSSHMKDSDAQPISPESNDKPKNPEISLFVKVFGQEVKYMRITPEVITQLSSQITDLILGKKNEIQTAIGAIKISKDSITIGQEVTKAFLVAHARQLEPTITGMPLHLHVMSSVVSQIEASINVQAKPSWFQFMSAKILKTTINVRPKISMFTHGFIQVHTPMVGVGVKTQNVIQMRPNMIWNMDAKTGSSYTFKAEIPTEKTDIFFMGPDPTNPEADGVCGVVVTQQLQQFVVKEVEVPLTVSRQNMVKLDKMCYGEEFTGVAFCIQGRLPSLSTLRFSDVPLFPMTAQTIVRVQAVPKDKAVKELEINLKKKQQHKWELEFKAHGQTKRRMMVDCTFKPKTNQLVLNAKTVVGLPAWLKSELTVDFISIRNIKVVLQQHDSPLKWTMTSFIDDTGRQMTVRFEWNRLPKKLRQVLQKYEPQIIYLLQTFASISREEKASKNLEIQFHLLSPLSSLLRIQSPLGKVESKVLFLPISVRRLPLSLQEITQWPYGQCKIQSVKGRFNQKQVSIFDQKSFSFSAPNSPCQHILVQDSQQKFVKVAVQSQRLGRMNLVVVLKHPQHRVIVVKPDLSVTINNKLQKQDVIQEYGMKIVKNFKQQSVFVTLNSKHYLQIQYQAKNVKILASPSLRNKLRGICGDNNGEDYQEFRSPANKIFTQADQFAKSWRTQC